MRISEYPNVAGLSSNDLFIIDTANGTRTVTSETLIHDISEMVKPDPILPEDLSAVTASDSLILFKEGKFYKINPSDAFYSFFNTFDISKANRKMIRRYKNLGTSISEAQAEAINSGSFNDIYIGDYWVIGGNEYYVADINHNRISSFQRGYKRKSNIVLFQAVTKRTPFDLQFISKDLDMSMAAFNCMTYPEELTTSLETLRSEINKHTNKIKLVSTTTNRQPSFASTGASVSAAYYSNMSVVAPIEMLDPGRHTISDFQDAHILNVIDRWSPGVLPLFSSKSGIYDLHGLATVMPAVIITSGCYVRESIQLSWFLSDTNASTQDATAESTALFETRAFEGSKSQWTVTETFNVLTFKFEKTITASGVSVRLQSVLFPMLYTVEGLTSNMLSY